MYCENNNYNQKTGELKWQDIQEVIEVEEVMDAAVVQVMEEVTEGQVTAEADQVTGEKVDIVQGQKMDTLNITLGMDGNLRTGGLLKRKWAVEYGVDMKFTISMETKEITDLAI
tara:strand:- start:55 stop:396 length:342 start_codon:yes stop_codon:yes gene_type:complete